LENFGPSLICADFQGANLRKSAIKISDHQREKIQIFYHDNYRQFVIIMVFIGIWHIFNGLG
jgi:hypothetical protein